ncbi:hypothetical protein WSS15_30170 [Acetobacter pasteurianus]|uniref:hypothetical protein n=1 Tax=Acetobacter pasteurianus TaxID=438 RepID=UPI0022CBF210|nr:hypothetical protein [Acetobacter pasteurianus]GLH30367.1 hypothetical protein WSS15_30170 [Acetobacter pasteurianus]
MKISFTPVQHAIDLVEKIAADASNPNHDAAVAVMKELSEAKAPPVLTSAVDANDDLQIDEHAFMAISDEGVWVQAWAWVSRERVPELYPDVAEEESPAP